MTRQPSCEQHEPTDECAEDHCYGCNVDEPLPARYYRACLECRHVFPTRWSLKRAYLRALWHNPFPETRLARTRRRLAMLTVRASRLRSCGVCGHDFF